MNYKICDNCGCKVDIGDNFCPDCGSKSFSNSQSPALVENSKPSLKYSLLYWNYDGNYVISKSKFFAICVFLIFSSLFFDPSIAIGGVIAVFVIALLVFIIGFCFHKIIPSPSSAVIKHNDYGLVNDLVHFLFFWQNKNTGEFVFSKTKIISHLIYVIVTLIAIFRVGTLNLFGLVLWGIIFEVPAFLIGYGIHKLTNPNPTNPKKEISKPKEVPKSKEIPKPKTTPKKVTSKEQVVPQFIKYNNQIDEMENEFSTKESNVRSLIEKTFTPPQLTYTKFISVVDKSSELFKNHVELSRTMIELSSEYSPKIENELKSKIDTLKTIMDKLDELTDELILTRDKSENEDVNNLFEDMEDLIKSVRDY